MLHWLKEHIKHLFRDRFYETIMLLCTLIYVIFSICCIHAGFIPTRVQEKSFSWNTQVLLDSGEPARSTTVNVMEENDIRYGKKVERIYLQDDLVLFVFEHELYRPTQLLVFDVFGEYLYGYYAYIQDPMQVAPSHEGILTFSFKDKDGGRCPVGVFTPNGEHKKKWFVYTDDLGFPSEAYVDCHSDYEAIYENGKYVIRNRESLEITATFDFSQAPTDQNTETPVPSSHR